jgi:hypothetical protein
MANF